VIFISSSSIAEEFGKTTIFSWPSFNILLLSNSSPSKTWQLEKESETRSMVPFTFFISLGCLRIVMGIRLSIGVVKEQIHPRNGL